MLIKKGGPKGDERQQKRKKGNTVKRGLKEESAVSKPQTRSCKVQNDLDMAAGNEA